MSIVDVLAVGETMLAVGPPAGGILSVGQPAYVSAAGAESNVLVGCAMLGASTAWLSRVGDDLPGELLTADIARHGVDTSLVRIDPGRPTGIMVKQPGGSGTRVSYCRSGSAASAMSPDDLDGCRPPRVVHTSGITAALSAGCLELVRRLVGGRLTPAPVSFDVNYRPVLWESRDVAAHTLLELARSADVVFVGRDEAEELWGVADADGVHGLLTEVRHLVVKDAAREAVEYTEGIVTRAPTRAVEIVDPVGAGDGFAAGWLTAWLRDGDAAARLDLGHRLAAAVLRSSTDHAQEAPGSTAGSIQAETAEA